ncbi:MAG TPA: hypothetical protein VMI94_11410 [Bryobacteraceae bacterium]|nr:hypothetical protein [Bryobacteraceae bacterium]
MQPAAYLPASSSRWRARPHAVRRRSLARTSDLVLSAMVCAFVVTLFAIFSEQYHHWFILPLIASGALIGRDMVPWVRRREMLFSPAGLLSLLGIHVFFISPLLMVAWAYEIPYLQGQPDDWRDWLGILAVLNTVGIYLYRWGREFVRNRPDRTARTYRLLDAREFPIVVWTAIVICTAVQVYLYVDFGGPSGFVYHYLYDPEAWKNTGWEFAIAESAPVLAMIALAVRLRHSSRRPGWVLLTVLLGAFFVIQLVFGALRGSRMNTIICLFWAAGIVHYWIRPIQRRLVLGGIAFLLFFMYFAAFYKNAGFKMFSAFEGSVERDLLTAKTHRTFRQVLVADMARSDIQAFTIYRLLQPRRFDYAWGRTYSGALALLIPQPLWKDRPPGKVKWTTELEYGAGSYSAGTFHSSRVYGVSGEMMLNFGILAAPLGLLIVGLVTGKIMRFLDRAHPHDCRLLLVPIWICLCFGVLVLDSDNVLLLVVKYAAIPGAVVMFTSRTVRAGGLKP